MPIDSSIALNVKQPQIESPLNRMAQVLQVRGMQDEAALRQMKADEVRRGLAAENALNEAYRGALGTDGAVDRNKLFTTLAGQGQGAKIPGLQKQFAETDEAAAKLSKTKAETGKIDLEMGIKRAEHAASVLSQAKDQASYDLARQTLAQTFGPQSVASMPPQFDPRFVQSQVAQGMTIVQKLNDERMRQQQAEQARHNAATEANAAGQLRVAQGNLSLRGQELEQSKNQPRGQFIETTDGYVLADPKSGAVRPVMGPNGQPLKGKAADRQLTDAQAKANLFGTRMQESDRILTSLEGKYSPMAVDAKMGAEKLPGIGGPAGYLANAALSKEGQMAEQAQRDFINAVLRRESGAVISDQEFANARKQYFPEPNDTPEKLAQKRRNRQIAVQGMVAEVPGGLRVGPSLTSTGQGGGASGGWSIQKVQ